MSVYSSTTIAFSLFASNLIVSLFFYLFFDFVALIPHHTDNTLEAFIANRHNLCRYSTALIAKVLLVLEQTLVSDTKWTDTNRNENVVVVTSSPNYCSALILCKSMSCIFAVLYLQTKGNKKKIQFVYKKAVFFELQKCVIYEGGIYCCWELFRHCAKKLIEICFDSNEKMERVCL